jgi:Ni,Fe-hydrogenase III small subunit
MLYILRQIAKTGIKTEAAPAPADEMVVVARLQQEILRTMGRALTIRQVDAGSCNGCELEIHALGNPYYNIEGLGIRFVASPRHADMLLVTGPVSKHMAIALQRTFDATPEPKLVVAVGDCGCSGGIFGESYASLGRVANVIPVDVEIPGCPPTPSALLAGILAAISVARLRFVLNEHELVENVRLAFLVVRAVAERGSDEAVPFVKPPRTGIARERMKSQYLRPGCGFLDDHVQ